MQEPISVSTPNQICSSGMKSTVTSVTTQPQPNTVSPLRRGRRPRLKQNPERRIKVQQMLCCQMYAPVPRYQSQSAWNRYTKSQQA